MELTIELNNDLEHKLRDQAKLKGLDLGQYIAMLIQEKAVPVKGKIATTPPLSIRETELFEKINYGFSVDFWQKLKELNQKRSAMQIREDERLALISMTDQLEQANVLRIKALIELAALRNTDLEQLMDELGILYGKDFQKN
ncbi:hypothetical protein [Haliscomenobacter hydrossis]|uniref:Uncharacterized protein n=1 Tax=Haliscomenobacter hydrossis (strain ATCC 27775 / DSM 1100 / LMG 10767 / O) TaxID=760192 RepID=F4KYH2_HALH1|nr:hypothetical protein [Haliscomenobacter hydrossis]AEE49413.1 hypothetical protein Halhy_1521 [Haliscomenobacter hydrossis DSM 1100]